MAGYERRLATLEASLSARLKPKYPPWVDESRRRWAKILAERERIKALPREEKLAHLRNELAKEDAKFEEDDPRFCPDLYDMRTSLLETQIMELQGASLELLNKARTWANQRFRVINRGRELARQAREDWKQWHGPAKRPSDRPSEVEAIEDDPMPETDDMLSQFLSRVREDRTPKRSPQGRRTCEPHRPEPKAPDRLDGFRARPINEDTLPYFEPDT